MTSFRCEICLRVFPDSLLNEHHKMPKSLGGLDTPENLSLLDSGCHQHLHSIAFMMNNQKRLQEVEPTAVAIFPTDANARKRLLQFSSLVAREMRLKKERPKDPTEPLRIVIEIPALYAQLLRLYGYDMPHPGGKPAGVGRVIRRLIAEAILKKYPSRREDILRAFKSD